jgi:hypothetical protein
VRVIPKRATVSTESIASTSPPVGAPETCRRCGAPLAEDQRYCLECGERCTPISSVLLGGPPQASAAAPSQPPSAPPPPGSARGGQEGNRSNAVTVIAGVGVLLLAMGVGVLIGRSGGSKSSGPAVAPQVITVSSAPTSGTTSGSGTSEASTFSSDWPAGKSGYTVQLQTLAQSSTKTSEVEAAKVAAGAKGAKAVGALSSAEFSSLTAGNYVIYSGVYAKQAEASKALPGLKKSFPLAKVVKVASGSSASSTKANSGTGSSSGAGSSEAHPASPKVLEEEHKTKGKSYEEKSKNLPDVVGT